MWWVRWCKGAGGGGGGPCTFCKGSGAVVVKGGGDDRGTSQGPRRAAKWYVKCSG